MDRGQAIALIQKTFNRRFDEKRFVHFVRCLVKALDESDQPTPVQIKPPFSACVKRCCQLGRYIDPQGQGVAVLAIFLQKAAPRSEDRIALRNFFADYLSRGPGQGRAAIVAACVAPHGDAWRFSFSKLDNVLESASSELMTDCAQLRPARCVSYLAGGRQSGRSIRRPLRAILEAEGLHPTVAALENAFNNDKVKKEFGEAYRELLIGSRDAIAAFLDNEPLIRQQLAQQGMTAEAIGKKLLQRIIVRYFLQAGRENESVPFADPIDDPTGRQFGITLPDSLFANDTPSPEGDIGTGIFDVFNRYPFTVHESEVLDKEIAIDPETLGKVFESLLPDTIRHASGTYYTPRIIVHYMCQQALLHSLSAGVPEVDPAALTLFLRIADRLIDCKADAHAGSALFTQLRNHAARLDDRLANLAVCDPAIGCGAFAVGMLHAIVRARMALTPLLAAADFPVDSRSAAALKRHAIGHCIYGVDENRDAIELTKLRLELSVAAEPAADEPACVALDFKIRQGNSLLDEDDAARCPWRLHFDEILRQRGGFDIVITNPPYVRIQELIREGPRSAERFKAHYASAARGSYDLYLVFAELALRLLADHGAAAFIQPHKFFNAKYGKGLRRALSSGQHVQHIVYFGDHQVFEGSTSYVCLLFLTKQPSPSFRYVKVEDLNRWYTAYEGLQARLPAAKLTEENWNIVIGRGAALHDRLAALPKKLHHVTDRIFQGVKTSADKIYIVERRGKKGDAVRVLCHQNDREYLLEPALLHPLIKGGDSKAFAMQMTHRLILFPYACRDRKGTSLISPRVLRSTYPRTWQYLCDHRDALRAREGGKMAHAGWYGYGRSQALDVVTRPKIFTPDLAPAAAFSFDATGACFFTGGAAGGYGILPAEGKSSSFLLGLLNSKVLDWFLQQSTTPMKGGWWSYEARYIRELPIPEATAAQRAIVERLVEHLLELRRAGPSDRRVKRSEAMLVSRGLERWVNALVYELFFPDSLRRAGLHFFRLAELPALEPLFAIDKSQALAQLHAVMLQSATRQILQDSFAILAALDEVRIIEGSAFEMQTP